jgi:transcriptional regulator with XRE-family HTH domain
MFELRASGWTLREIGERYGISRQRVDEIVRDRGGPQLDEVIAARQARQVQVIEEHADEIRGWWRAGEAVDAIAQRLDLPAACVQRLIGQILDPLDRAHRNRAIVTRTRTRRYADEDLLDGIRAVATQVGRTPTQEEYRARIHDLGLASILTLGKRFGGWQQSLTAAGLTPLPRTRTIPNRRRWNPEACWQALEAVADQLGDPPRFQTYVMISTGRDDLPSGPTIRNQLGRWIDIVIELTARRSDLPRAA